MGPLGEALTLTTQGLDSGHPGSLFLGYVDTDLKDDSSHVWYNMMNSIISTLSSWPPLSSGSQSRH